MATVTIGSTYRFCCDPATRDGELFDLTGATVDVVFRKPDGTYLTKTATVTNGPQGLAEYVTVTTDLTVEGQWETGFHFVKGQIDVRTEPVALLVVP